MKKFVTVEQLNMLAVSKIENITSFNSVIIVNDYGSQPERLIWFLKTLSEYEIAQLLAVNDHKGSVSFLWDDTPPRFRDINEVDIPDGDVWSIYKNYQLSYDNKMLELEK